MGLTLAFEDRLMARSPIGLHASSAGDLRDRLEVERRGQPFVIYRDGVGRQVILELPEPGARLTVGRRFGSGVQLDWDTEVSRLHAELERIGEEWTLVDDGLSRNGSFVNGNRVSGRHRLRDGDALTFGDTVVVFRAPAAEGSVATVAAEDASIAVDLPPMQRKVLVSLCRPFKDSLFAAPATNQEIAAELQLSGDTVKTYLRAMFSRFGIEHLPQNQKRARLAAEALGRGIVSPYEL
jgi:pSer/pThr/pTyr-binding forkhead associated (FHA) protein